jgi:hypothetical protein
MSLSSRWLEGLYLVGVGHLSGFGTLYVLGILVFGFGQIALAIGLSRGARRAFARVPLLIFVGLLLINGGGGLLVGVAWVVLAAAVLRDRTSGADPQP